MDCVKVVIFHPREKIKEREREIGGGGGGRDILF